MDYPQDIESIGYLEKTLIFTRVKRGGFKFVASGENQMVFSSRKLYRDDSSHFGWENYIRGNVS